MNIGEARRFGTEKLRKAGIDTPRLDADLLLCKALGWNRAKLLAHPEVELSPEEEATFLTLLSRRENREPLAYIIGFKEFYGLRFKVTPAVLIPRPETELLVEMALKYLAARRSPVLVVDVGTGSGAVSVAISVSLRRVGYSHSLHEISHRIIACDLSPGALSIAKENAESHGANVHFVASDLLSPCSGTLQLIVANLPYIPTPKISTLQPEIRLYEPKQALDGGEDGLDHYRRLIVQARALLDKHEGLLLMEIGASQGAKLAKLAASAFPEAKVDVHEDLAGIERVVSVKLE